ncbi:MAG: D-alanyl-D-alanine carboxypeptidase/D-alanyl-D-alanine-endopeptidase [Pseudomonadota bacterium]
MIKTLSQWLGLGLLFLLAGCQAGLRSNVEAALTNPDQTGIRWGLVVADMDGTELLAVKPEDRFTPASNTKIVTTMAAYHHLAALTDPARNPGTQVFLVRATDRGPPNLILRGGGDAMLTDATDCESTCLATLADAVAAFGIEAVGTLIGDDTLFPNERWGPGWSQEDLQYHYGTAVSALSVNDNLVWLDLAPGARVGHPARLQWQDGDAYFNLFNQVITTAAETPRTVRVERLPGADRVRVYGNLPIDQTPFELRLAVDNPAELAALRMQGLLEARGISVDAIATRHRPLRLIDEAPDEVAEATRADLIAHPIAAPNEAIATLAPAPLTDSLKRISKDSQNLHAELALRRLGLLEGTGSRDFGVAALEAFLDEAGLSELGYAFHGGSGMSIYNRISPRSMVQLLAFAARQPWFEAWLADQPIGGIDGSLERRFVGTPLEGKIFAKTGTLNGANALSGMMIAESGRELLFSIIANDRPATTRSAMAEMDAALNVIAAAY